MWLLFLVVGCESGIITSVIGAIDASPIPPPPSVFFFVSPLLLPLFFSTVVFFPSSCCVEMVVPAIRASSALSPAFNWITTPETFLISYISCISSYDDRSVIYWAILSPDMMMSSIIHIDRLEDSEHTCRDPYRNGSSVPSYS